jgi:hypothetical protein
VTKSSILTAKGLSKAGTEENFLNLVKAPGRNLQLTFFNVKNWALFPVTSNKSGLSVPTHCAPGFYPGQLSRKKKVSPIKKKQNCVYSMYKTQLILQKSPDIE